ncbi:hypothetical protein [Deinococcus indicus]|uniref:hypothetical protein n=1 Tax=Deinococcus indicus TaxID=223556 RepID=UPI001555955C|nr:hypothetical protein [Deinococcus indicus]
MRLVVLPSVLIQPTHQHIVTQQVTDQLCLLRVWQARTSRTQLPVRDLPATADR